MVALGKASNAFLAWSASQGIETTLNLAERADGRFVTCNQDINAGQDLLSCPLSACIIADSLEGERCHMDFQYLKFIIIYTESFGGYNLTAEVAEYLAYERKRGEKSKYAPYIDVLPTLEDDNLRALPRFWNNGRLDRVTDGGQLEARILKDERKDIGECKIKCITAILCSR
jgi:hypothetical protein